uniref:isoaspartyl peptidase/L-asparaginase n=1 Tax=Panthera onca TaxID=9690 RepID=UPI0029534E8C|nr:isoaspartyl peptidase/L-asparaginase [Panthera onca]
MVADSSAIASSELKRTLEQRLAFFSSGNQSITPNLYLGLLSLVPAYPPIRSHVQFVSASDNVTSFSSSEEHKIRIPKGVRGGSPKPTRKLRWVEGQRGTRAGSQPAGVLPGAQTRAQLRGACAAAPGRGFTVIARRAGPAFVRKRGAVVAERLRTQRSPGRARGGGGPRGFGGRPGGSAQPEAPASASAARGVLGSVDMNPVIVVHGGGASNISKDRKERVRQGIIRAATEGYKILKDGGSAVDAVEGAVTVLEDDPEFNAGQVMI